MRNHGLRGRAYFSGTSILSAAALVVLMLAVFALPAAGQAAPFADAPTNKFVGGTLMADVVGGTLMVDAESGSAATSTPAVDEAADEVDTNGADAGGAAENETENGGAADVDGADGDAESGAEAVAAAEEARRQAVIHYGMARQLLEAGRVAAAIAEYQKAAALDPRSLTVKMELAAALLAANQRDAAREQYEQIIADHPSAAEAYFQLARMALGKGDDEGARKHFEQILQIDEDERAENRFYALALYYLALRADEQNDHAAAAGYFEQLVEWIGAADARFARDREIGRLIQLHPQLVAKTAQLYLIQRQAEKAVAVIKRSSPQMFANQSFSRALVRSLLEGEHHELALQVALQVQELRPMDAASFDLLSRVYQARKDEAGLVAKLREIIAASPENVIARLVLGERLLSTEDEAANNEAVSLIEKALWPGNDPVETAGEALLRSLVEKLLERDRADLALGLAEGIRRRQPQDPAVYYLLERVHRKIGGDAEIMRAFFDYAMQPGGRLPIVRLILGKAMLKLACLEEDAVGATARAIGLLESLTDRLSGVSQEAREALAEHYHKQGDEAQVVRLLGRTVSEQHDQAAAMYRLLHFIDTLGDKQAIYSKAAPKLASAELDRAERAGVQFVLGLLSEMDDPENAAVHYEAALQAQEKFLLGYERLSALYIRQDRLMNALDTLRSALYSGSRSGVFFRRMGVVYELVDRDVDAIATYRTAMRIDPQVAPELQYRLANVLARIGRMDEGLKVLREATEAAPNEVYSWYNLARYQMQCKQADEALATLDRAAALMPDRPQLQLIRGWLLLQDGRYADVLQLVEQLSAMEDFQADAEELRVSLLIAQRKYAEAEAVVRRQIADRPDDVRLKHTLAGIKSLSGDFQESERILSEVLEAHPRDSRANNDLGYMWADRGHNLAESERMIRTALQEDPESSASLDSLGWVLYKQGRIEESLVYLRRSVRLDTDVDPLVYDHLGDALVLTGESAEALKYYRKAIASLADDALRPLTQEHVRLQQLLPQKVEAIESGRPVPVAAVVSQPHEPAGERASPRQTSQEE